MSATGKRDFTTGVGFSEVPDGGSVSGTVGEDEVILVRRGEDLFAVGAYCTHYHGSLADGLVVGETVRCPLHHACFDLRTGQALRAPALDPISCWRVERQGGTVFVREKAPATSASAAEAAAALRTRNIEVHVAGHETVPMQRVLGADVGRFVQSLHESHGVEFHLGATVAPMDGSQVTLTDGTKLEADFLVVGVDVRPATALASAAGLKVDRGVCVNEYLETSAPGIYAAGDIARWPDPYCGERIRVEHWVVAERQGQARGRPWPWSRFPGIVTAWRRKLAMECNRRVD